MNTQAKRILVLVAGWGFILLGIVGLFLPILQGVLFILIGLAMLSSEYVWAHHLLRRIHERFPTISSHAQHAREKAAAWLQRLGHRPRSD